MRDIILPITSKYDPTGVNHAERGLSGLGKFAAGAGIAIAAGLAVGATALVRFGGDAIKAAADAEAVSRSFEQIAKNSGFFGTEEKQIRAASDALIKHAEKMSELTGIDDEAFISLERYFMSVPELAGIGEKGLQGLAQVTADIAAATGKDLESVGNALAKAMANPETAIAKLQKAGVFLSDSQVAVYDSLVATGKAAEAQGYLIEQLGDKYAGAAEAAANPFEQLKAIVENFKEDVGAELLPVFQEIIPIIAEALSTLASDPKFKQMLLDMAEAFKEMIPTLIELLPQLTELAVELFPAIVDILIALTPLIVALAPLLVDLANGVMFLLDPFLQFATYAFSSAAGLLEVIKTGGSLQDWAKGVLNKLGELNGIASTTVDIVWNMVQAFGRLFGINLSGWRSSIANLSAAAQKAAGSTSGMSGSQYAGKALGGQIGGDGWSWVGENGPELAKFPVGTHITPAHKTGDVMAGGGGSTYNINISTLKADATIGEVIVNSIKKYERTSGAVFMGA